MVSSALGAHPSGSTHPGCSTTNTAPHPIHQGPHTLPEPVTSSLAASIEGGAAVGRNVGADVGPSVGTHAAMRRATTKAPDERDICSDDARPPASVTYFAYSTARVSRMTVTLIWPG